MEDSPLWAIPASVYLEFAIVTRRDDGARDWLDGLIERADIRILPIDAETARLAADAFARYGRGAAHPAALNFGDCLAYAVARQAGAALLFKGSDFRHTDVKAAL